jgi:acylphosphatase
MNAVQGAGKLIRIQGTVQGVGLRPWIYRTARSIGICGRVHNDSSGVTIEAFGSDAALTRFIAALEFPPRAARISTVDWVDIAGDGPATFEIVGSTVGAERLVSIPPDLATCPDCLAEIFDPTSRRYRYPFTNCTNCGPRFTIATDTPYDRAATTMAPFAMCPECRREYQDVADPLSCAAERVSRLAAVFRMRCSRIASARRSRRITRCCFTAPCRPGWRHRPRTGGGRRRTREMRKSDVRSHKSEVRSWN